MSAEEPLRHPASWAEQILDSWTFCSQAPIVGLAELQFVNHPDELHFYTDM